MAQCCIGLFSLSTSCLKAPWLGTRPGRQHLPGGDLENKFRRGKSYWVSWACSLTHKAAYSKAVVQQEVQEN